MAENTSKDIKDDIGLGKNKDEKNVVNIPFSIVLSALAISIALISYLMVKTVGNELDDLANSLSEMENRLEDIDASGNPIFDVREINNFDEYMRFMRNNTGYRAFIAVKDIQGFAITEEEIELLKELGFDQADVLLEKEYHAFLGIVEDGMMIYQKIGGDENLKYETKIGGMDVKMESATLNSGNKAIVSIDGTDYSVNKRGINIVFVESEGNRIVDSVEFDTHDENIPAGR